MTSYLTYRKFINVWLQFQIHLTFQIWLFINFTIHFMILILLNLLIFESWLQKCSLLKYLSFALGNNMYFYCSIIIMYSFNEIIFSNSDVQIFFFCIIFLTMSAHYGKMNIEIYNHSVEFHVSLLKWKFCCLNIICTQKILIYL